LPKFTLETTKLNKTIGNVFLLKIQKRKTKNWINPPNSKNHKTRFLGGKFFFKLQIKENIEILINLSNS
jgi:hypothetical protein